MSRHIVHIDMDAFFASVEQRDNPSLRGKAVIIGADPLRGRGVVSTCSYEARKFGLRSAMPISKAFRLCPNGVYLRPRMTEYAEESAEIARILKRFTPDIETASIDEAYLDITGTCKFWGGPLETCVKIKKRIAVERRLPCSVGLAPNKLLAKIASEKAKPGGLLEIKKENTGKIIGNLPAGKIPGIGPKTAGKLKEIGITDCAALMQADDSLLFRTFGAFFLNLKRALLGRPTAGKRREKGKSVSREITFPSDIPGSEKSKIRAVLLRLADSLSAEMRKKKVKSRKFAVKIRFSDFRTEMKNFTLAGPEDKAHSISRVAFDVVEKSLPRGAKLRLIGLKATLPAHDEKTPYLFGETKSRMDMLYEAMDLVRETFGNDSITLAGEKI